MVLEEALFQGLWIGGTGEKLEAEKVESYYLLQVEDGNKVNPGEGGRNEREVGH